MTKKRDEILMIQGQEEKLKGDESDQSEEQPEEKQSGKKVKKFFSTSDRPQPKRKNAMLTTRDLDADGKLIKKREASDE